MDKIIVISVVRDFAMYEMCVAGNPHLEGGEHVALDNREKNEPIPVLYNRFLDACDFSKPAWFVFCHEDFQSLEPLAPLLEKADKNALWGPVGARTVWHWGLNPRLAVLGGLQESEKSGEGLRKLGTLVAPGTFVDTLDCQCLIVHSSLVRSYRLRFDERFCFDLYSEDFCVAASHLGIASRILPMVCRHWSRGVLNTRYQAAEQAFAEKWPNVCVTGTSSEILGGGAGAYRRMALGLKRAKRRFCSSQSLTGMGWSLAGRLLVKAVQFGFSIVLARLLCPVDFGLVGMIAIFTSLADVLMDGGLVAALIRKAGRTETDFATVFWSKLAAAVAIYAVLFFCAPLVASFYGVSGLVAVVRVVSLGLVCSAASSVLFARLQTACRFRDMSFVQTTAVLLSGAVGVVLAWRGLGVWAVVGQGLSWHVFMLGLLVLANRWLPGMRFSTASLRAFFGFGWKHLMRGVLDSVYSNGYAFVIGMGFGAADLGLYNRADYYTAEIGTVVGGVVNEVNYPILSGLQDDNARLCRSYRRLQWLVAAVMFPGMAAFAVLAEPFVRFVIGPQWLGCVPYLRVLAVGAAFVPLARLAFVPMYVKGRSGLALKLELVEKPFAFVLLIAALPFGIFAICLAKSVSSVVAFAVNAIAAKKMLEDSPIRVS